MSVPHQGGHMGPPLRDSHFFFISQPKFSLELPLFPSRVRLGFCRIKMLVISSPRNNKFTKRSSCFREDYFPLTLTLSPIGERG